MGEAVKASMKCDSLCIGWHVASTRDKHIKKKEAVFWLTGLEASDPF